MRNLMNEQLTFQDSDKTQIQFAGNVQFPTIFTDRMDIKFAKGDLISRNLPNKIVEVYRITDPVCYTTPTHMAHYELKVERVD